MLAQLRRSLLLSASVLLVASSVWAQVTTLEGDVKDENGKPVPGAQIVLNRTDIKGNYKVKSNKKGHWFYTGLPFGTYDISCEVNGAVVDKEAGVKSKYGESVTVDFNTGRNKAQQAAAMKAAETGQLTDDQTRGLNAKQKEELEAKAKAQSEAMKKNKALNDAFNAGVEAMKTKDYKTAVDQFTKASQLDATQQAVWAQLGDANSGLAATQTGDDKTKSYDQALAAFQKALDLKPNDPGNAAIYNQMGNIYGSEKKMPEATQALTKAAQLDPQMAAKAYYNMGANLVNSGQNEQAADFFKKAIDADPNYADAHYQYGICLMAKATVDSKTGKVVPPEGTGEQFQKYLELKPDGPYAQPSKDMLASLGETVQTKITVPGANKKKK
ncbi:MAG TPA: tetratricopeptide repeat protein [Bryobacteraceae bacterium]|jgi:tetratricopeptide (TPR) repeat protein|nr:tetratricopeptide repeat protein [Bryobacteraceae bacterium]